MWRLAIAFAVEDFRLPPELHRDCTLPRLARLVVTGHTRARQRVARRM